MKIIFENRRSIIGTQRSYTHHFNVRHLPIKPTIMNLVKRFQELGSVGDRSRPGRSRSVRKYTEPKNTENVRSSIEDEPTTSTRTRSWNLTEVFVAHSKQLEHVFLQGLISAIYNH